MKNREAILLALDAADGEIHGRTNLQKILYFAKVKNRLDVDYRPHFYGPYSGEVAEDSHSLVSLGFIDEDTAVYPCSSGAGEDREKDIPAHIGYIYKLTQEGERVIPSLKDKYYSEYEALKSIVRILKDNTSMNSRTVSVAAKVHYILKQEGRPMGIEEIESVAGTLGWEVSSTEIGNVIKVLKDLGLVDV